MYFIIDVNAAVYGEYVTSHLYNEKIVSLVYYTIGAGVGGGAVFNGKILQGIGHPEMGHTFVKRHPDNTHFVGICPYHHDCLARLVAEPTFEAPPVISGTQVSLENHVWDIMAYYVVHRHSTNNDLMASKYCFWRWSNE